MACSKSLETPKLVSVEEDWPAGAASLSAMRNVDTSLLMSVLKLEVNSGPLPNSTTGFGLGGMAE